MRQLDVLRNVFSDSVSTSTWRTFCDPTGGTSYWSTFHFVGTFSSHFCAANLRFDCNPHNCIVRQYETRQFQRNSCRSWGYRFPTEKGQLLSVYELFHINSIKLGQIKVLTFLEHDVELCQPSFIHICDGSDEENRLMLDILIAEGIVQPLPKYENWYVNIYF